MTTQVIITSPKPNHQRVRVRSYYAEEGRIAEAPTKDWKPYQEVLLDDGESHVAYVHGGMAIYVDEVAKPEAPAAETEPADGA